jgi:hypothetical protein
MKKIKKLIYAVLAPFVLMAQSERYAVTINEILADPSPIVGLPNTEFIELRNNSKQPVNLYKWKIDNGSTSSTISTQFMLGPDSLVVLCSKTQSIFFSPQINTIGLTSFPSLSNDGDLITLSSADGKTMHAVEYEKKWFNNVLKSEGGWSLEMIDPYRPCDKHNWTGSIHFSGGTPGKENSVLKKGGTTEKIEAMQCIALDEHRILLHLNQGADSLSLSVIKNYAVGNEKNIPEKARAIPPLFNKAELYLKNQLLPNTIYELTATSIMHCNSKISDSVKINTGLVKMADEKDLAINEILFDPPTYGSDYIEIYNKSLSVINAKEIYLSNKNEAGTIGTAYPCSLIDFNIFPGDCFTVTTDTSFLLKNWPKTKRSKLTEMKALPSFPDDNGHVLLMNKQGKIIDEFKYTDDCHFPLLRDKSGVSLEKTNPNIPSNNLSNWHSASATSGYGTPTHVNSQFIKNDSSDVSVTITPENISPNNDGISDILSIQYQFQKPENLMSIYAFDYNGSLVKKIVENGLCGTQGFYFWDGLDGKNMKVRPGLYIILVETIDLNGRRIRVKKVVAVL